MAGIWLRGHKNMALSVSTMKTEIINALQSGADTAEAANKKFADAILKNICDTMQITYAWSAANPSSGATDPVVFFNAAVSGAGTLTPSNSLAETLVKLATLIKGLTISAATGFTVEPLAFNSLGTLVISMANEDTQDLAMDNFCAQLITSLKTTFPNPTPATGAHGAFTGAATGMVIA
jgi:hypothetical protein